MNRSIVLLGVVLATWMAWYLNPETPNHTPVVVLAHPARANATAASVPQIMAYPRSVEAAPVTLSAPRAISAADSLAEQGRKEYTQSRAYRAFWNRRNDIWRKYHEEVNKPRFNQGLEPLPEPKVEPTPEERAAMISEFQAGIRELDKATTQQGYPSTDIVGLLGDLHEAGIAPIALGTKAFGVAARLGQAQADYQAKYVEELLERGCFGTAGYIMSMYVNKIAEALGDPGSMGYTHLNGQILALHAMERHYARASTEEATDAVVANLARQRAKSIPGCGFG